MHTWMVLKLMHYEEHNFEKGMTLIRDHHTRSENHINVFM